MAKRGPGRRLKLLAATIGAPLMLAFALGLALGSSSTVKAQQAVGIDPGRDCQTIRTCNFSRRGAYRGCLSSYTCRTCRMVPVRCSRSDLASGRRQCQEFVCNWGG
jgi:hypothetical protein